MSRSSPIDFDDQPFVITQPKHSDPFGNPQIDPVPRADVAKFYADFWGVPGPLNHGHTIHEYWMEQSRGKIGIPKIDVFGPYRMPRKLFRVRPERIQPGGGCPTGYTCNGRMERDVDALWRADAGADIVEVRYRPPHLRRLRRDDGVAGIRRDEVREPRRHS